MNKSDSIKELSTALSKAQAEIKGALKDSTNPFFKSTYSDLTSVIDAIRVPFAKYGLSFSQPPNIINGVLVIETVIMHSSGEWISGIMPVKSKDDSPQAMGSGTSYTKRYALQAMAGIPSLDDDAQAAQGQQKPQNRPVQNVTYQTKKTESQPVKQPVAKQEPWPNDFPDYRGK